MTLAMLLFIRHIGTDMRFAACCWFMVVAMGMDVWIVGSVL